MMTVMDSTSGSHPQVLLRIERLPQSVPNHVCLSCEVCCRFPEAQSFLRPYFTGEEVSQAVAAGIDRSHFPDGPGSQIRLAPHPTGEGYVCPAFDATTSRCRIYDVRPLDCRIYPLAVMWSADGSEVVLGWDSKCPFMTDRGRGDAGQRDSIQAHADRVAAILEEEAILDIYYNHPRLIGRYQEDVVVVRALPRLTEKLTAQPIHATPISAGSSAACQVRPLTPNDYPRFQQALRKVNVQLASYGLPTHLIWRELFTYLWAEYDEYLCLFAEYGDGVFMPLPPIGKGSLVRPLEKAWAFMREQNRGSSVSRIENIPEKWKQQWESWGYRLRAKDADYLYEAQALAELRGDPYKSQRAACNRFERMNRYRYMPYQARDREACLDLYRRWAFHKRIYHDDPVAAHMLSDSLAAHRETMDQCDALGLRGRLVWVDGALAGYTFGFFQTSSLFCILLEVTDRSFAGLSSWVFREVCREAYLQGAAFINTMDDSSIGGLARSKQSYRPVQMLRSFIATES